MARAARLTVAAHLLVPEEGFTQLLMAACPGRRVDPPDASAGIQQVGQPPGVVHDNVVEEFNPPLSPRS